VIFLVSMILIAVVAFVLLNHPVAPLSAPGVRSGLGAAGFQITGISKRAMCGWIATRPAWSIIKSLDFVSETRLHSDAQTAWEFLFEGFLFTGASPGAPFSTRPDQGADPGKGGILLGKEAGRAEGRGVAVPGRQHRQLSPPAASALVATRSRPGTTRGSLNSTSTASSCGWASCST